MACTGSQPQAGAPTSQSGERVGFWSTLNCLHDNRPQFAYLKHDLLEYTNLAVSQLTAVGKSGEFGTFWPQSKSLDGA